MSEPFLKFSIHTLPLCLQCVRRMCGQLTPRLEKSDGDHAFINVVHLCVFRVKCAQHSCAARMFSHLFLGGFYAFGMES